MPPNNQTPVQGAPAGPETPPGQLAYPNQQATAPAGQPNISASSNPAPANPKPASTQNSLLFSEIRENMIIMSDGSFRAIMACKSINFDLMSSREREGVEFSYQNFLNALYFPVQILVRSQRVDIGPYIDKLLNIRKTQDNILLGVLMDDYINFVDILSQEANIMDKSFFVVVPYYPTGDSANVVEQSKGFFAKLFPSKNTNVTTIDKVTYEKAKDEIRNRVDAIINGLLQVGVSAVQLNTKEIGELLYSVYNPDTAVREPLGDFSNITNTYTRKGGAPLRPPEQEGVQNG